MKLNPGIYKVRHLRKRRNKHAIMFVYKRPDTGKMCYDIDGGCPVDLEWFDELSQVEVVKKIQEFNVEKAHIEIHVTDYEGDEYEYKLMSIPAVKRIFRIYPQIRKKLL